jgi:quinohemoprotein ethanol dehydrogenase
MQLRTLVTLLLTCNAVLPIPSLAAGDVNEERLLASISDGSNWLVKGGNALGQHYSALSQINAANVADLGIAWATDIPAPDGIATTPIVVDGVIYLSAAYSVVYAIDANNGNILWSFDPDVRARYADRPGMSWTARASRGIAVWKGKVLATTADCRLIALEAGSGKRIWSEKTCDPQLGYGISDSPYVGDNKVFVGNSGSESGKKTRGYVSAYDIESGKLIWRFYTVPSDDPAENTSPAMKMAAATWSGDALEKFGGGGNSWNEMTYDPETGLLFFGTAGALPYTHSVRSPDGGDNLFLSSVLAVRADTGEYVWHYQTVPQDSWDYNATMNIALAEFEIRGAARKTLLIAPKNGFHYVLDRLTGKLLAADKFARVNWASHINLETGRPVYSPEAEYWAPDADPIMAIWPNMWGAHNWNPMAWHPDHKLSYIPVIDVPSIVSDYEDGDFADTLEIIAEVDGKRFSPGKLVAFDPLAGEPRWTVEHELPFNGGVMATAGNLVFQGDAKGRFNAYAADTGQRLWSVPTGSSINSAPATYAIGGKQFIVIPIGSGGGVQFYYPEMHSTQDSRGPTRLLAFRLGGGKALPSADVVARQLPDQPKLEATSETIELGKKAYASECSRCHGKAAAARFGGSVPDLRYSDAETHAAWHAIVVGGSLSANDMPAVGVDIEESEAIRAYVLSLAEEIRRAGAPAKDR